MSRFGAGFAWVIGLPVLFLIACGCQHTLGQGASATNENVPGLRTQLRVGEGLPLEFAFRNRGAKTAYVELVHGARINDAGGEPVLPPGPIDEPGPPPADHFARVNGRMTYVVPVEGIEAGQRIVETVSDVLARYHPLARGRYTVIPVSSVRTYNHDSILTQEDLPHKAWAQPASAVHEFELESNPITIEVW